MMERRREENTDGVTNLKRKTRRKELVEDSKKTSSYEEESEKTEPRCETDYES